MSLYSSFSMPCEQLGLKILLLLTFSVWGTKESYGMAMAIPNNSIETPTTSTTGLTPQEVSLLVNTIGAIISNTNREWYPESFAPSDDMSDVHQVTKLQSLADTGMKFIETVDKRLKNIQLEEQKKKGRWGFLEDMDDKPYRVFTKSPDIVFEIQKYDCLKNEGMEIPSPSSKNIPDSVWMRYADTVYVPFNCPRLPDFDREQAAKEHQRLMARLRRQERSLNDHETKIVQVNFTLTNETFNKALYNQNSREYKNLTDKLTKQIVTILNVTQRCKEVDDFSYRPGSVIATFHAEMIGSGSDTFVKNQLEKAMGNNTLSDFAVDTNLLEVGEFLFENAVYEAWGVWSKCSKTCGDGLRSRRRSCNSTEPLACAHQGPAIETKGCYEQFCSDQYCRQTFTNLSRGNFSSPVVDGLYPRSADCVWQIRVDENHTIVVQFEKFNLEKDKKCKYDYVAFYDGLFSTPASHPKKELLRFCGNSTPPHSYPPYGYPVNSSSNNITIHFRTDESKERLGFTAIWHKVLKYHLRVPKIKSQSVTLLSFIYNPWSVMKGAAIPLGTATTCPKSRGDDSCYFSGKQNVISRITSVFFSRDMKLTTSKPIEIKFEHILDETFFPGAYTARKTCVTWDHTMTSSQLGSWTKRGCSTSFSNLTHTICKCIHTGIFAVLSESEPPLKDLHIKANTYFGCAVFLILVIATVQSLATKEKKTTGELFHLFEAIISGILMVIFLTGAHVPAEKELCGFLAFFLYYLVLSQFTWMLLTVFWMQNILKRFFNERVRIKIVYFVIGWGIPIIPAGVAGKVNIDQNGHEDNVCWVSIRGGGTVWGYGAPVFAMFIVNVAILVYLLLPIVKSKYDCGKLRSRIVKEFVIMLSFIITWCLGVKVILNDSFKNQYFFCIFLVIQGAVNYNVSHEPTELFWKNEEVNTEHESEKEENTESTGKDATEEKEQQEVENLQPRMTVKTLKNLNIYKENGVFVIEA